MSFSPEVPDRPAPAVHLVNLADYTLDEGRLANLASEFYGIVLSVSGSERLVETEVEFKNPDHVSHFASALICFRRPTSVSSTG